MILAGLLICYAELASQEVKRFTLKEAQQYAVDNNYQIRNARTDMEIARQKVKENTAIGFPQVSGSVSYNNYLEIPTQLIPGEFFDSTMTDFIEIKFGTQHNATWSATASQLLFSGKYLVGLQAARAYETLTKTAYQKSEIELKAAVAKTYYPVIILRENRIYLDSTLTSMKKMLNETEEYYKSGFVEDTDVDQFQLMIADMETTLANIDNQLNLANNMLKFMLGLQPSDPVELTETLDDLLVSINNDYLLSTGFDFNSNVDYRILKKNEKLNYLQMKLAQTEYYPTVSAFYSYQENAMRDEFDFFDANSKWYPTQIFGVQLDVPIWSSGMRKYKVNQAKLELEKIRVQDTELQQKLSLDLETARSEFSNTYLIYTNRLKNRTIAQKIHQKTEIKYKEGISGSLDLSQSYNQYLNAEISYLASILDLLIKKTDLEKLLTKSNN